MNITIKNCNDKESVDSALRAVYHYINNKDLPQHKNMGKRTGGGAKINGIYFFVWQTTKGWTVELTGFK
jgi:hypothetical protein